MIIFNIIQLCHHSHNYQRCHLNTATILGNSMIDQSSTILTILTAHRTNGDKLYNYRLDYHHLYLYIHSKNYHQVDPASRSSSKCNASTWPQGARVKTLNGWWRGNTTSSTVFSRLLCSTMASLTMLNCLQGEHDNVKLNG